LDDPTGRALGAAPGDPAGELHGGVLMRVYGHGSENGGAAGVPVAGGFDCDDDGFVDMAFAQIKGDPLGRTNAGEVTLVFGDGTVGSTLDSASSDPRILRILGDQTNEITGAEIWMDDVTGDGLGDLLIGRQNHTPAAGREGAGALTILIGSASLRDHTSTRIDLRSPPTDVKIITIVGKSSYDRLGIWMRTGDVDGDGIADIVVGADETDAAGQGISYNSGAAYVIRGGPHLASAPTTIDLADFGSGTTALDGHLALVLPPDGSSDYHFGATVQIGDLDGNGRGEVLIAATLNRAGASLSLPDRPGGTGEGSGGSAHGTAFISWDDNFPALPWPPGYSFPVTAPSLGGFTRIDGLVGDPGKTRNRSFGEDMLAGLDYSGDGLPDLFVGDIVADTPNGFASGMGNVFYNAANLRGLNFTMNSPPPGVRITTIYGPQQGAIGNDTTAHGDFDHDGVADLAIGNPHDGPQGRHNAGSVHIFYGQPGGWPALIDQSPGNFPEPTVARSVEIDGANGSSGSDDGDVLCYSAAVADIDGDGRADFIVNEMVGNGAGGSPIDIGNLLVISGAALLDPVTPSLGFSLPGPVDFGSHDFASAAGGSIAISITNTSGQTVDILSLAVEGPEMAAYSIISDSGETSLDPGQSRTVTILFNPATAGVKGAALSVITDADEHKSAIGLHGAGIDPAINPSPTLSRPGSAAHVEFASQAGATYELRRSSDLVNWFTLEEKIPGTGGVVRLSDPENPQPQAFYQVIRTQ
jgi:hypothetical protein